MGYSQGRKILRPCGHGDLIFTYRQFQISIPTIGFSFQHGDGIAFEIIAVGDVL
jgi:hypothetical protein